MQAENSAPKEGASPSLLEDWLTIWHSELAAMLGDRELYEGNLRMLDTWAAHARALLRASAPFDPVDRPAGSAWPVPPSRAAPAAAAPDARNAELAQLVDRLSARIDDLERRLAGR